MCYTICKPVYETESGGQPDEGEEEDRKHAVDSVETASPEVIEYLGDMHGVETQLDVASNDQWGAPPDAEGAGLDSRIDFTSTGSSAPYQEWTIRAPYDVSFRTRGPYGDGDPGSAITSFFFPYLPPPPVAPREPKRPWPAEARALAQSLLRAVSPTRVPGLRIEIWRQTFSPRHKELLNRLHTSILATPRSWLERTASDYSPTEVAWCNDKERGVYSETFGLGCVRAAKPADLGGIACEPGLGTHHRLDLRYPGTQVEVVAQGAFRLLVISRSDNPAWQTRVLVDPARGVVLKVEDWSRGKRASTTRYDDFVEVAGAWWAGRIEEFDAQGRQTDLTALKFTSFGPDGEIERQIQRALAGRDRVQLLPQPLPTLARARTAAAVGKARFEEQMTLLLHYWRAQQWSRAADALAATERLSGKPGMRWVRTGLLKASRRHEELKQAYFAEARRLVEPDSAHAYLLAQHLLNNALEVFEPNEVLALLDTLWPVYERQLAYRKATKEWTQTRTAALDRAGQDEAALQVRRELARQFPDDSNVQQAYAQALVNLGDYEAAYAWLDAALAASGRWEPAEEDALRSSYAGMLQSQGRWHEAATYLAAWVARGPEGEAAYRRYLAALVWDDRIAECDAVVTRWLAEAGGPDDLAPAAEWRLNAAILLALGQGDGLNLNRIEDRWQRPLGQTALTLIRHPSAYRFASEIMNSWPFRQTDQYRQVQKAAARLLQEEIAKLLPAQIQSLVEWVSGDPSPMAPADWKQIARRLRRRWDAEPQWEQRKALGSILAGLLSDHVGAAEHIAFLRTQLASAPDVDRAEFSEKLFNALCGQPWSEANEDEAFGLWERLSDTDTLEERLGTQVWSLYRLTDRMANARFDAEMKAVEHPEKLTRSELRAKRDENQRRAREGLADRLRRAAQKAPPALIPWLRAEQVYFEVRAGRDLPRAADECWELLLPLAVSQPAPAGNNLRDAAQDDATAGLRGILRYRCLVTLVNLAARKDAKPALVDRLAAYLAAAAKDEPEQPLYQSLQYKLLVSLDRPKDLEIRLRQWVANNEGGPADPANPWQVTLGYLLAEQGRLPEAVTLLEPVGAAGGLSGADYRALALWHTALGQREAHDRAEVASFKAMDEYRLSRWIAQMSAPWLRNDEGKGPPPRELDARVPLAVIALLQKSGSPQNYRSQLDQFYAATHDFRLLAALADAVIGHTAGQAYPFLQDLGPLLAQVGDEATADAIVARIAAVRKSAASETDRRALDLLELLVERRAAELQNQPGPHVDRALAALQRACKRPWTPGEPRLMASLLAALGTIAQPRLADEQIRQLEALHAAAPGGSADRLHIADRLTEVLWNSARRDRAIDLLTAALDEYQAAAGGRLSKVANEPLSRLVGFLGQQRHFVRAEKLLQAQLDHPANTQQKYWLEERLLRSYRETLAAGGEVSLGSGPALYQAIEKRVLKDLDTPDQGRRQALVQELCAIYHVAFHNHLPGVAEDLRKFAFGRLPAMLARQTSGYENMLGTVAQELHDIAGPRDGIALLVQCLETVPGWLPYCNNNPWQNNSQMLGPWREQAGELGDLQPRLLQVVCKELRRDLHQRNANVRYMYHAQQAYYWRQQEDAFVKTAQEVLAAEQDSPLAVRHIAEYLYYGVNRPSLAIDALLDAQRRKVLDESAQMLLVNFLQGLNRFAESIPILEPLVERHPESMQYRTWLMRAYFKTNRPRQLAEMLQATDAWFHRDDRWQEPVMAGLGESCLENQFYERSAGSMQEAIAHRQRTTANRGVGDGTLACYYATQARAYAGLKKTPEAVEAACAAVVSWGPRAPNRRDSLYALHAVIFDAPDLDAYVALLDRQTQQTGLENPILRKAIGQVYLDKNRPAQAIKQLGLAAELQPNDAETYQALLDAYDRAGDKQGTVEQLLHWCELARRDIKLYEDLGTRLTALGQTEEAERAFTSIVEILPTEAESHQRLAEIRQRQNRWAEAAAQWEQVVRLRALEPTGLLGLAAAQLHLEQWDEAAATLAKLKQTAWPARFEKLPEKIHGLEQQLKPHQH